MIKKAIIGTGLVLALAAVVFGTGVYSYVRTSAGYLSEAVTDNVPLDFQIDRARGLIRDLVPEIRKNMHVIAKEEVEVERLERETADAEAKLAKAKGDILRLTSDLGTGKDVFVYAGRNYTASEVKSDLHNRFERFKTSEATLATLREIHKARQTSLDAAREQLKNTLAEKRRLEVEVENLEARLKMVAAAQTTSEYNFDDSKLARAKELINDLRARLDVAERLVHSDGHFQGEIPLDEPAPENIVDQVTEYFGQQEAAPEALAQD